MGATGRGLTLLEEILESFMKEGAFRQCPSACETEKVEREV